MSLLQTNRMRSSFPVITLRSVDSHEYVEAVHTSGEVDLARKAQTYRLGY
jgi:hypothetical protein